MAYGLFTGVDYVSAVLCFGLPAFFTAKALKSQADDLQQKQLYTTWIIFALFYILESLFGFFVDFFPFFYELKMIVIVIVALPQTGAGIQIYDKWFAAFIDHYALLDVNAPAVNSNNSKASETKST